MKRWPWLFVAVMLMSACAYAVGTCRAGALYCVDNEGFLHVQGIVATPGPNTIAGVSAFAAPVQIGDGSSGTPAYSFSSGTGVGMWRSGSGNPLRFSGASTFGSDLAVTGAFSAASLSGTFIGTYTLAGTPTITAPTISSPSMTSPTVTSGAMTLTSGQLTFPATQAASADVNTLDDYEEGTWTPSLGGTTTYATQTGTYTKIGRVVTVTCVLNISSIGTGSTVAIGGLPFGSQEVSTAIPYFSNLATSVVSLVAVTGTGGSTQIQIYSMTAAGTNLGTSAIFASSTTMRFSLTYIAST